MLPPKIEAQLAPLLTDEQRWYLGHLAHFIQCPADGRGLLPALELAVVRLKALSELRPLLGLDEYLSELNAIAKILKSSPSLPSHVRAVPAPKSVPTEFQIWITPVSINYTAAQRKNVDAALAACLLGGMGKQSPGGAKVVKSCLHLMTSPDVLHAHASEWKDAASRLKFADGDLGELAMQLNGLADLTRFIGHVRTSLNTAEACSLPSVIVSRQQQNDLPQRDDSAGIDEATEGDDNGEEDDDARLGSLCRWLSIRATKARFAAIVGVPDWDVLPIDELAEVCRRIDEEVRTDPSLMPLGTFAIYLLVSGLPPHLARQLSFCENGDIWIEPANGKVFHSRDPLFPRQVLAPELIGGTTRAVQLIGVSPPSNFANFLVSRCTASEVSSNLQSILFPNQDWEDIQTRLGHFLRSLPEDTAHLPFTSRFGYSLGPAITVVTGNPIPAAFITQHYAGSAAAEPDYISVPKAFLHKALADTFLLLGLEPPLPDDDQGFVGSAFCPSEDAMRAGMAKLQAKADATLRSISPRMKLGRFLIAFNKLNDLNAAAFVSALALRGKRLEELNWSSLFASPSGLKIGDKETPHCTIRLVPRTPFVDKVLCSQRGLIDSFAKRIYSADPKRAEQLELMTQLKLPKAPVFVHVVRDGQRFVIKSICTSDVAGEMQEVGLVINAGRHFFISHSVYRNVPIPVIRSVTGHGRFGGHGLTPFSGISPRGLISASQLVLARLHSMYFPTEWPCLKADLGGTLDSRIGAHLAQRGRMCDPDNTAFTWPAEDKQVSDWTLPAVRKVMIARRFLLDGAVGLSARAASLLSITCVDGISRPASAEAFWRACHTKNTYRTGCALLATWQEADHRQICQPLLPLTQIYVCDSWRQAEAQDFLAARDELVAMLRKLFPTEPWHTEAGRAFSQWCWIAQQYAVYVLPPWVVTASDFSMHAAAISPASVARLVYGRPAQFPDAVLPPKRVETQLWTSRREAPLKDLLLKLRECGSTEVRVGEEDRRRTQLGNELKEWKQQHPFPADVTSGIYHWIKAETDEAAPAALPPTEFMDVSSVSDYADILVNGLWEIGMDPLDFSEEEWTQLRQMVLQGRKGEQFKQKLSILRRLGHYCCRAGSTTSVKALEIENVPERDGPTRSASIHYVSLANCQLLRNRADADFQNETLNGLRATAYTSLCTEHPLRSGEPARLALAHHSPSLQTFSVTTSGYSHLKRKKMRKSRRWMRLATVSAVRLESLRARLLALPSSPSHFFITDDGREGMKYINQVHKWMSTELKSITGELGARPHSLRGSCESRLVCPQIEDIICSVVGGHLPPQDQRSLIDQWRAVPSAASVTGHHPLSAMQSYLSIWPLVRYAELRLVLSDDIAGSGLSSRIPGLTETNLRQISCRAKKSADGVKDQWTRLLKFLEGTTESLPSLEALLVPSGSERCGGNDSKLTDTKIEVSDEIRYLTIRTLGADARPAADITGISFRRASELDALSTAHPLIAASLKSGARDGAALSLATQADIKSLFQSLAASTLNSAELSKLVSAFDERRVPSTTPEGEVINVCQSMLSLLPQHLTLSLLPESAQDIRTLNQRLAAFARDILVKPPSRDPTMGFRVCVLPRKVNRRGPRAQGLHRRVVRSALLGTLLIANSGDNTHET